LRGRPFTPATAARYGVTARQLQGDRFRQVFRGVYLAADLVDTIELLATAVGQVLPAGAVVSGTTAALLHGADVRRLDDVTVTVTMLRDSRIRRSGIRATAAYLERGDVCEIQGVPVTSPVRTAFDLARQRDLVDRVVGLDAMLNRGGCRLDELVAYVDDRPCWRGIRWAREAITYAEPMAESVMETRQRMRLVLGGLPRPAAQFELLDRAGRFVARLDHAYERYKVAPEWDGAPHEGTWRHDNERQERIRDEGWWHRRYTMESVREGWDTMVLEVRRALLDRGWTA
jgi:very-short-patch-repair endonuclease